MGKISKGEKCSVQGCGKEAIRSLNANKVTTAGLKIQQSKRAYLCKDHYKEFKKATKKDKIIDKWRYGSPSS